MSGKLLKYSIVWLRLFDVMSHKGVTAANGHYS